MYTVKYAVHTVTALAVSLCSCALVLSQAEALALTTLRLCSVIQFKEVFLTEHHLAIVMEFAPGGDMFQFVKASGGLRVRHLG